KLLGAAALLLPRFPRLKEWAYAGVFFEMTGAAISLGVRGADVGTVSFPLLVAAFALASWALRPPDRTLGVLFPATRSRAGAGASALVRSVDSAHLARPDRTHVEDQVEA